jgi:hypothetical protein
VGKGPARMRHADIGGGSSCLATCTPGMLHALPHPCTLFKSASPSPDTYCAHAAASFAMLVAACSFHDGRMVLNLQQ